MTQYSGRIVKVSPRGYAWIDRNSVTQIDGPPVELFLEKDIYIHHSDSKIRLAVDAEITFDIVPDTKRASGFRAVNAKRLRKRAAGIDLHVDASRVDNPSVPMRWCFTPEMHKRITEGLKQGYGYAVMLVGKRRDDHYGYRQVREVFGWKQPFTFFTFAAPGDWDVCAILFERTNVSTTSRSTSVLLEGNLRSVYLSKSREMGRKVYDSGISDLEELQYLENPREISIGGWSSSSQGMPIAAQTISVSVPKEIFAPEPSEAVKAYGNYFFRQDPGDQCEFRQRLMMMIPGFFPWILIETLKRVFLFLFGLVTSLFCLVGTGMILKQAFMPAICLPLPDPDNVEYKTENGRWRPFDKNPRQWFVPGMLLIYAALGWVAFNFILPIAWKIVVFLFQVITRGWVMIAFLLGVFLLVIGVIVLIAYLRARHDSPEQRDKRYKAQAAAAKVQRSAAAVRGEKEAAQAITFAPALVCGEAPAEVSLRAIPKELRTRHMLFASLKQRVCKPFAR